MKKTLSILLALCMLLASVSAMAEGAFTPAASYETGERVYDAGEITTAKAGEGGGTVTFDVYSGIEGKDYTDEKFYTFNDYTANLGSSMNWDPLSWETNDDSAVLDYISSGFYSFALNSDKTGYSVTCELAAEMPVDVTAEYVGKLGVAEGETGKAWRIALNQDATWDNGEKITAKDFEYSIQQLLNPKMLNRRADSYYAGQFVVYNAKNYLYSGKTSYDLITDTAENLIAAGTDVYLDMGFWGIAGAPDAEGNAAPQYVSIADETMYRDAAVEEGQAEDWVSAKYLFDNYLAAGAPYESYQAQYLYTAAIAPETSWEDVGFKVIDDYTIDFILANPVEEAAFYLPYNLSSSYLVYEPLYESCKSFFDADGQQVQTEEEATTVTTTYCRSLENSVSYGPYKLTSFELDKEYTLSRNEQWYGYRDGKHLGQYQTDEIKVTVIAEHATAMLAFEKGEIDGIALQSDDLDKYGTSQYVKYGPNNGYTTKLSFNTNYDKLLSRGTNSQVLVIDEFRQAFAYCYDRKEFATAYTAAGTAGFGLLNELYCYNPFTGETYRGNDAAKAGLLKVFDVAYGEGTDYATLDEAYEAMTGYDVEKAQALMKVAYDKAVAAGIYDGESPVEIEFRVYQNDEIYVKMFNYLNDHLKAACVGSGFEGKVSLKMTVDSDYYNTNYSGGADMIFTTWGGASMSPFTILYECYCDAADGSGQQMEYGYDTSKIIVNFVVDGQPVSNTLQNWALWADNSTPESVIPELDKFTAYDYDTRCAFYAQLEAAFMNWYPTTSVYYRNTASMDSQKVQSACDEYINLIGFGGIAFMTYNYDDAAWAEYIANNELVY
jgi:oligopeptide transport system substrate-binding protein